MFYSAFIFLAAAADIIQLPVDVTVTSPNSASFTCTASGLPRPKITWNNPDSTEVMPGVDGVIITEEERGLREIVSTLNLTLTAPSMSGEYRCVADNGVIGRGELNKSSVNLTVLGEGL